MLNIRYSTQTDYKTFKPSQPNIDEIRALTDLPLSLCMALSWNASMVRVTVENGNEVICLFGVNSENELWLFFSEGLGEGLEHIPLSFYKIAKRFIGEQHLHGRVYINNEYAIKLVKFLGFELDEPKPFGPKNELFMEFRR